MYSDKSKNNKLYFNTNGLSMRCLNTWEEGLDCKNIIGLWDFIETLFDVMNMSSCVFLTT